MNQALILIANTVLTVICVLFLARLLLQAARADFYNPISQGIVKATDPFLKPLRMVIPGFRNIDIASFVAAWLTMIVLDALIFTLRAGFMGDVGPLVVQGLHDALQLILTIYWVSILIVIVMSFLAPTTYHPLVVLLAQVTEPLLAPARRLLPALGGLDFSPILVFLVIRLVQDVVLPRLFQGFAGLLW